LSYPPWDILEDKYYPDLWKVLVCCACLNRTTRRQAEPILDEMFGRWPTALDMAEADPSELAVMVKTLGLQNRRSSGLIQLSAGYCQLGESPTPSELSRLHLVGPYAMEAHRIVFLADLCFEPADKVLRKYVKHLLEVPE
jgi:endonuclease III